MKKLIMVSVICAVSLFIFACDWFDDGDGNFWAQNIETGKYYKLQADLKYDGKYCTVWVEKGSATDMDARKMGETYDNNIYPKMIEAFGYNFVFVEGTFNTMQVADAITDADGKLCILLLDIKDGYKPNTSGGYVAGYFDPASLLDNATAASMNLKSNQRDMIFIDTYPQVLGSDSSFTILAHEMQHLMNTITRSVLSLDNDRIDLMDLWINEGLSSAAEWLVSNERDKLRIVDFNENYGETIDKGNNFFVWDPYGHLDDYSTVYMFFQWLRIQSSKGTAVYRDIISSQHNDYKAVTTALGYGNDFGNIMRDWYTALYLNNSAGSFGYKNEPTFTDIKKHYISGGSNYTNLLPGEGVFSYISSSYTVPSAGSIIKYAGMGNDSIIASGNSISSGRALLTYNSNYNNKGGAVAGTITGHTPPAASVVSEARSILGSANKPYPISAGEMLRRNNKSHATPVNIQSVNLLSKLQLKTEASDE